MFCSIALRNHYQTLGIGFRSTPSEVKAAFRGLAKKYHPDQNQGNPAAEKRFREVKEAYECLSNKLRRAEYDRDWVRSGRVHWDAKSESSSEGAETPEENQSGELSRNQLLFLYAAVIGLPFLASLMRRNREPAQSYQPNVRESSWATVPELPEVSPRDELVRAFYNPLMRRWERLEDTADPPTPLEVFKYVLKEHRGVYQQIVRTDRLPVPAKDDVFSVHQVPFRITKEAVMAVDRASGVHLYASDSDHLVS